MSGDPGSAPVAGLLLAAGGGSRLGTPKALLEVGGESLLDRAVGALRAAGCAPIIVVLGASADRVPRPRGSEVIVNPDWATGMGSSLRAGLSAVAATDAAACAILLVDTPGIGAEAVRRVIAATRRPPEVGPHRAEPFGVAVADYGGRRGHPVVIGRQHWPDVARLAEGDVGARPFLAAHPDLVRIVPCADIATPDDLDTADAVAHYVRWRNGQ